MLLSTLLQKIEYSKSFCECEIGHVTNDSRKVTPQSIFVCIRGFAFDGHDFAQSAYERGARVFIAERELDFLPDDAQVLVVENTRKTLALFSCEIYGDPSHKLKVIGITGTKGKTTTALMIKHLLVQAGIPCGYIGSNGVSYGSFNSTTANTTPESNILQSILCDMVNAGMKAAVIEVSSQALKLYRTLGIRFEAVMFTNLSLDHVGSGEHDSFDDYFKSKKMLFDDYESKLVIANADDGYTQKILEDCKTKKLFYSIDAPAQIKAANISSLRDENTLGSSFECIFEDQKIKCKLPIPGEFNIYNALAAISVGSLFDSNIQRICQALSHVSIDGRFEVVNAPNGACFVIDYAHNGLSLKSALLALRAYDPNRLICLFGSVGNRTQLRRVQLGRVAAEYADFSILTSDNPDTEDPMAIIDEIASQYLEENSYIAIPNRKDAIEYALDISRAGDIFLLAGKGHERYQLVNNKNEYFCEREILMDHINELTAEKQL